MADFLLLPVLFVIKENCKFLQVTKLVAQICLLCAGAKVLLSPALSCLQCNNIFVKEQSSAKKVKGRRGQWELICAGGAFRSWSVCTCTQHLLHLSPQWISLLFWKPGKNLSKACLNYEQCFTDTFPAVCPAFEEWCLPPGTPCVLSRSPQPSSRDISKGTSKWAVTGSLFNPDSFTAVICPYPWSHTCLGIFLADRMPRCAESTKGRVSVMENCNKLREN